MALTVPYAASNIYQPNGRLVDLIRLHGEQTAEAQRRAGEIQAQMWGNLGSQIQAGVNSVLKAKQEAPIAALNALKVDEATQLAKGQHVVDSALKDFTPTGPQPEGAPAAPTQHPYLSDDGLVDPTKVTQLLNANGMGHLAPDLLKGIDAQNAAIAAYKEHQQATGTKQTIMLGSVANTTLALMKAGMPFQDAASHASSSLVATGVLPPQAVQQQIQQIAQLPPDQQLAGLQQMKSAAARLGPTKTLADGAKEVDMFGETVADNPKIEKPTEAMLAADAATLGTPTETPTSAASKKALDLLKPPKDRTGEEQALDAYAKSIGKTTAADLTYADRRQFEKDKATTISDQAFLQHQREREYDIKHPVPVPGKPQQALEQEYRTILARGLSSRSGGLGMEDAKVQTANHLLALMDQNFDPKTGEYNIPNVQYQELALGMAKLLTSTGAVGEGLKNDLVQATAEGDLKKVATYLTGKPFNGSTQDVFKMLRDSIERQGGVAMENREGEMRYLRGLAPTDLEENRRQSLEATTLNPLRQSRVIANPQTGQRRLQTSIDGGKTWK